MNEFLQFVDGLKERRFEWFDYIKELLSDIDLKAVAINGLALAMGIFLGRCGIKNTIYPFAQGYFICMLMYSVYYKVALAGCLIGWISLYPSVPISPILVSFGCLGLLKAVSSYFKVERSRLLKAAYIFLSIGGVMLFSRGGRYFAIVGVLEAVVSICSLIIYDKAARALVVHKKRRRLTDDEALCVAFCLCIPVIFAGGIHIGAFEVNIILAGFITMLFAYIFGGTVGAASGILSGLCVSLGGGSIYVMGSMGVCGFFAGILKRYGRLASVVGYMLANMALTLYINGSSFVILPLGCSVISGVILVVIPKGLIEKLRELMRNTLEQSKEERYYVEKCYGLAREKIDEMAGLFKTMSALFFESNRPRNRPEAEISGIIKLAADECCKGCLWHKKCWEEDFLTTYSAFQNMTEDAMMSKGATKAEIAECINEAGVRNALERAIKEFKDEKRDRTRIKDGNDFLSKQFDGIASLLTQIHGDIKSDVRFESDIEKNIKDKLTILGIMVYDVCVMNVAGGYRCEISVNGSDGGIENRNKIGEIVSEFCGRPMTLQNNLHIAEKNKRCSLIYVMERPLKVNTFMAQSSKENVCGDSYKIGYVSTNKYMLCISDGMGSGKSAHDESDACVRLIHSFFKAGFDDSVVFATVNRLLQLRSDKEIFTTVDLCMIDTARSRAVFTKIGAVPSVLIKRHGHTAMIRGESLPLGILEEVNEKSFEIDIEDGDILVMFTDGVYDALCGQDTDIDRIIGDMVKESQDIRGITSQIIERCKKQNNVEIKDDMTILVSVFKKEKSCP